ncbi:MAG: hypothetical protein O8C64_01855 [Candidatus Methanoperedens sp.]|nr:hypothetical protein [Candidatus Methanoperedens sp.]MCZ7405174.1 hypothetical protein [Candidatus Methanoperedens sp.]
MAVGLGDIYEKLKELITVVDKVRENTEAISELKGNQEKMQANLLKLIDGQQRILERLEYKEELASLKIQMAEHIAACEKAKA